nr:MAG TPA: hypothetical protein [Caudoviricetes sp.]
MLQAHPPERIARGEGGVLHRGPPLLHPREPVRRVDALCCQGG